MGEDETTAAADYLGQIWSLSTTLSPEAIAAAAAKCTEMKFDPDRGLVPLQETFINLSAARALLEDAIRRQKLIQLPITVQKEILANLQAVARGVQGLTAGADEVVNITTSVEALNTSIWKYGLHNLSDEVLGYQTKMNQIKNLEVQLAKATAELRSAQTAAEKANSAAIDTEQKNAEVSVALEQIKQNSTAAVLLLEQVKDVEGKTSVLYAAIQQQEKQSGELTSGIKTANNELLSLDTSIRKFYGEVEDYRKKINQTTEDASGLIRTSETNLKKLTDDTVSKVDQAVALVQEVQQATIAELGETIEGHASATRAELTKATETAESSINLLREQAEAKAQQLSEGVNTSTSEVLKGTKAEMDALQERFSQLSAQTVGKNQRETDDLISELAKLKDKIREQIQQATGFTLFGAFQARQNMILKSKNFWVWAITGLVAISAFVTAWIAHEAQYYQANSFAFWVKLSLTVPLGFAITFCTVQYSRERRLEEEYAFKSSISVSLNPYRDLIQSMLEKDPATDQTKYVDFVIDSVTNVFTSPTGKVFDSEKKAGLSADTLKQATELIGTFVKAAK
jgi:peptidoglycan hydrolase CwlO-like protein